jgi:hypothetical protein
MMRENEMFENIKQNKVIFFIFGVYLAALAKEVSMLLTYRQQADYLLLDSIDRGNLFIIILVILILVDGLAVWFMLKQHQAGLWLAILSTVFKRGEEYFVLQISFDNFDLLKDLFIQKRLAKGRPVDEQMVSQIISPELLTITYGFMGLFSVIIVILLLWKRDYFYEKKNSMHFYQNDDSNIAELLDELQSIGFYQYVDSSRISVVKAAAYESGYLYGDTGRFFWADAEDLVEGGVGSFFQELQPFLEKQGVHLTIDAENFLDENYFIVINKEKYILYIQDEIQKEEFSEIVTQRAFSIINKLLEKAGSKERLFALYGWNDQVALFLTNEMYEKIIKFEPNENEWPRIID